MAAKLFTRHDASSHARYQGLKQLARTQQRILEGAPGILKRRTRGGTEYWVREFNRIDGRKVDEHVGTVTSVTAARVEEIQAEIDLAKALISGSSTLRLFGYQRVERKTAAVLAALFNHGLFQAGLTLVGAHAYGALLNEYGVVAPAYRTQDIDVARSQPLQVVLAAEVNFGQILNESGLNFVAVPGMPSHKPSASFKVPGVEALSVDLLVPGKELGRVVPVGELRTHGQEIPLLDFLLKDPIQAIVLAPNHVVPVNVPAPERFVLHKLVSSQLRKADRDKIRKDLEQAAVLAGAMEEDTPSSLEDAFKTLPVSGRTAVKRGAKAAVNLLEGAHPSASDALDRIARR